MGAAVAAAHVPTFEPLREEDLNVLLHRPGDGGEQRARGRTDRGPQAVYAVDRDGVAPPPESPMSRTKSSESLVSRDYLPKLMWPRVSKKPWVVHTTTCPACLLWTLHIDLPQMAHLRPSRSCRSDSRRHHRSPRLGSLLDHGFAGSAEVNVCCSGLPLTLPGREKGNSGMWRARRESRRWQRTEDKRDVGGPEGARTPDPLVAKVIQPYW